MSYQWERPEGSGIFSTVWRVDLIGEGFDERGDHVWIALVVHAIPETDYVAVGPIKGGKIK